MKIAIVGAGIAGIGAARLLKSHNHDATLWEKSAHVGGRVGTFQLQQNHQTTFFDHGAQNVKMSGRVLDSELNAAGFSERVLINAPTCLRDGSHILPPDKEANAEPKWTSRNGMRAMPQFLAQELDVRLNTRVSRLQRNGEMWVLHDEANRVLDSVERVIVTLPAPQAADLLEASDQPGRARIELLRGVEYSRCLSV
ncbi:MAG TPA: FAD-dependent oxidoreductase, partial [Abditibacteriaceae bacterium]|nr:FAD-dependent oxidoreductase [Abditibacteriaceae bacterium]